jgi:cytochrome P450 family 150 subfamily A5
MAALTSPAGPGSTSASSASCRLIRSPHLTRSVSTVATLGPTARHIAFGRGVHSCPGAPLVRAEARVCIERLLDRTTDIRIDEDKHGPADDRRYQYVPTFILRGLTELHFEFTR